MNVTVLIPRSLQRACDGRQAIELGVPPSADLPDILQTLLSLYPRLMDFVADESRFDRPHFRAVLTGQKVLLFALSPRSAPPSRRHDT